MISVSIQKAYNGGANSALCAPPQYKSDLKTTAKERYRHNNITKREKNIQKNKITHRNNERKQETTEAVPLFHPALRSSRSIEEFQELNLINEGAYGVVYKARDKKTNEIVAIKVFKDVNEKEGFTIAAKRELTTLLKIQHPNVVSGREIVMGSSVADVFLVMEYVPHELQCYIDKMRLNELMFTPAHIKCLMTQLLSAVDHLHKNGILHRDLKPDNILMSQDGILKVADFGMAREYEVGCRQYTPGLVTRWYRAPELLLFSTEYSTPIDIWSVGCIFAELITLCPLFPGKSEVDQLNKIYENLGTPSDTTWPGYSALPAVRHVISDEYPPVGLRKRISADLLSDSGLSLLHALLTYDPARRERAAAALRHPYFKELPVAIQPDLFPTSFGADDDQFSDVVSHEVVVTTSNYDVKTSEDLIILCS